MLCIVKKKHVTGEIVLHRIHLVTADSSLSKKLHELQPHPNYPSHTCIARLLLKSDDIMISLTHFDSQTSPTLILG